MSRSQTPDEAGAVPCTEVDDDGHRATDMPSLGAPARIVLPDPFADADAALLRQPAEPDPQAGGPEPAGDQD